MPTPPPNGTPAAVVPKHPSLGRTVESAPAAPSSEERLAELVKQQKAVAADRMRFGKERDEWKREKETTTGRMAELEKQVAEAAEWKKKMDRARVDPGEHLKELYGEDYYDKLTRYKLEGVPPADMIAKELMSTEDRLRADYEGKLKAIEEKLAAKEKAEKEEADRRAFEAWRNEGFETLRKSDKYPLLKATEKAGSFETVIQEMQKRHAEMAKAQEAGEDYDGDNLTFEQAADLVHPRFKEMFDAMAAALGVNASTPAQKPVTPAARPTADTSRTEPRTQPNAVRRETPEEKAERIRAAAQRASQTRG